MYKYRTFVLFVWTGLSAKSARHKSGAIALARHHNLTRQKHQQPFSTSPSSPPSKPQPYSILATDSTRLRTFAVETIFQHERSHKSEWYVIDTRPLPIGRLVPHETKLILRVTVGQAGCQIANSCWEVSKNHQTLVWTLHCTVVTHIVRLGEIALLPGAWY